MTDSIEHRVKKFDAQSIKVEAKRKSKSPKNVRNRGLQKDQARQSLNSDRQSINLHLLEPSFKADLPLKSATKSQKSVTKASHQESSITTLLRPIGHDKAVESLTNQMYDEVKQMFLQVQTKEKEKQKQVKPTEQAEKQKKIQHYNHLSAKRKRKKTSHNSTVRRNKDRMAKYRKSMEHLKLNPSSQRGSVTAREEPSEHEERRKKIGIYYMLHKSTLKQTPQHQKSKLKDDEHV